MAVCDDATEIVRILNEEGFGVLAGEVLAEINLGHVCTLLFCGI